MVTDTKEKYARDRETMPQMFDWWNEGFRTAMDAGRRNQETWFKAFTEAAHDFQASAEDEDSNYYKKARRVWDAAFDAMRTNADAFGEAATRGMEHYTTYCQSLCREEQTGRHPQKTTKSAS